MTPTTVVFETASLADAFRRAQRVAPARGGALTQLGGFMMEVGSERVLLRATDGDVFLSQFLDPHSITGPQTAWRIPSQVATKLVTSLPGGQGQEVTVTGDGSSVILTQGRMTATIGLMDHTLYPAFRPEPIPEAAQRVDGFGTLLDRIAWAASRKEAMANSSILVTEQHLVAATQSGVAMIPHPELSLPGGQSLVSLATVSTILAHMPDVALWLDDNAMYVAPSPNVQARCRLWAEQFPSYTKATSREFGASVLLQGEEIGAILTRLRAVVEREKEASHVWLTLGDGQMTFQAADSDGTAAVTDQMELVSGMAAHQRVTFRVAADVLSSALGKTPGEQLVMRYDLAGGQMLRIDGQGGYSCWIPLIRQK